MSAVQNSDANGNCPSDVEEMCRDLRRWFGRPAAGQKPGGQPWFPWAMQMVIAVRELNKEVKRLRDELDECCKKDKHQRHAMNMRDPDDPPKPPDWD